MSGNPYQSGTSCACPRCHIKGPASSFGKLNNENQLYCISVYRCPECGHIFAPVPESMLNIYWAEELGVRQL